MNFESYYALITEMPHIYVAGSRLPIDLELETVPSGDRKALLQHLNRKIPIKTRRDILSDLAQDSLFLNILRKRFAITDISALLNRLISLTS